MREIYWDDEWGDNPDLGDEKWAAFSRAIEKVANGRELVDDRTRSWGHKIGKTLETYGDTYKRPQYTVDSRRGEYRRSFGNDDGDAFMLITYRDGTDMFTYRVVTQREFPATYDGEEYIATTLQEYLDFNDEIYDGETEILTDEFVDSVTAPIGDEVMRMLNSGKKTAGSMNRKSRSRKIFSRRN